MYKFPNSQLSSSTPSSPNSSSYLYDYKFYTQDQNLNSYPQFHSHHQGVVPLQKSHSYPNYQSSPTPIPTQCCHNRYMAPIEDETNPMHYYYENRLPSYSKGYPCRKTQLIDPDFHYISNHSNVDFDQHYFSSQENSFSSPSVEDLDSYLSPVLSSSLSYRSMPNHERSLPKKRLNKIKSYIERSLDNEAFDGKDETLLRVLAEKYKNDFKKISKRMFRLHDKKFGPNFLRLKNKELTDDSINKRVRFTHHEDLMIAKYCDLYGHDWTQVASYFPNRTPIMLKNRYYHMKKKGIYERLVKEVQNLDNENLNSDKYAEDQNDDECPAAKKVSLSAMNFDLSDFSTEAQDSGNATPDSESQNYDDQEIYNQTLSNDQTSCEDQPLNFLEKGNMDLLLPLDDDEFAWMNFPETFVIPQDSSL